MAFASQIWTLMSKNFRLLLQRHIKRVIIMAVIVPLVLAAFFSFAKNLFVPPATYGFGKVYPVMTLSQAFEVAAPTQRTKVVLVDSGYVGGEIQQLLDRVESQIVLQGPHINVVRTSDEENLVTECRSSLRGVTKCFGAIVMKSSPTEGGNVWKYTIRTDAEMWNSPFKINVDKSTNPEEVYILPMQRVVDSIIANMNNTHGPNQLADVQEQAFTSMTQEQRAIKVRENFHKAIVNFMGIAFIATIIWITYHLTGLIATERESGMSQLLDAMMPTSKPWMPLAARIISHHVSFTLVYAPAWIIGSIIVRYGVFANTSIAIVLISHILGGIALASMSILFASLFKKAQLSGITAILVIALLGILAQSLTAPGSVPVGILSALFTPCCFVYFITFMSRFEIQNQATDLTKVAPNSPWKIPGLVLWVFLIAQIFIYALLAALIEKKRHGTSTVGRKVYTQQPGSDGAGEYAVQLDEFTKIYTPGFFSRLFSCRKRPNTVVAVNKLSFNVRRGQIVALLGANGSGKSTTLDAIAGLNKLTSGTISIDGRGGLGIAPQKNVLWDDLTVEEHLRIFDKLKSPHAPATNEQIAEMIESIDLTHKRKARAGTLSGGQKRKLQLGMMLIGGSAVCCVDEVSSGIDPLSRRKLWDILLAERGKRTLILTTHFLDEADLLADHIAILSKGTLRAEGSSVELKDRLGGGYRVQVHKNPDITDSPEVPGVRKRDSFDLITYAAPTSGLAAQVIKELQTANITDYRFSGPTIEDVFLQLAEEIKDEEKFREPLSDKIIDKEKDDNSENSHLQPPGLRLLDGRRVSYFEQTIILFQKRWTVFKRNWILYAVAFFLPILAAALTSLFVQGQDPVGCKAEDLAALSSNEDAFSQYGRDNKLLFLFGPPSKFNTSRLSLFQPVFEGELEATGLIALDALSNLQLVDTFNDFEQYITDFRQNVTVGIWLGDDSTKPTIAWVANLFVTSPLTAQQFLDVLVTNTTIGTTWSPFDLPFTPDSGKSLNLVIYMGLALACYPAFFALYPSNERRKFVRSLQYSNGVRPFPLWMAYLIFDFTIAFVGAGIVTALWYGLSRVWYHIEYIFVVLFLYGLASILVSYMVSLFTKSQLATFAWAAAGQVVFFLGYLIAYLCVNTYVEVSKIDSTLLICHFVISAFMPIGSVIRAIFVATNLFSTACNGTELSTNPAGILQYGGPVLYLTLQCFILFGLLVWFDGGSVGSSVRSLLTLKRSHERVDEQSDEELANELNRVTSHGADYGLKVLHLTKSFGKNTAVDNVTFGIKRGEVFALLGPNGAGKSTTISLIRGDIKPSLNGGDIFIEGVSVTKELAAARANLGVCPQIDALDQMTVREHLEFYAKIRGVSDVPHNVNAVLAAVGLSAFESRMAVALSGGNKRKLSLGIALMGNPGVVLLDEPSSGLDAASKRVMWKTLQATVPGRSILLTTHSMEEADALAGRAGILARRMLALGTPDDLRHRFGDALHVRLVSSTAPRTTDEEMGRIIGWIRETLPTASVETKTYHGQMRFSVHAGEVLTATKGIFHENEVRPVGHDISQGAIGRLVILLEENKARLGVEHYSVSPTTLDQVFLAIVGKHNIQEENHE